MNGKYTDSSSSKKMFDRDGFVTVKEFLSTQEVAELKQEIARLIAETVPTMPASIVYYEDKSDSSTVKQIQHLNEYSTFCKTLAESPRVVDLARHLLGGEVNLVNMQYFNKVPRRGRETPPHQDGYYFMIQPQQAVTMWLSLGHADANNGAVAYLPGSHKAGMRPHSNSGVLGFSQGISDWSIRDQQQEQQMVAEPGDLLVHHCLTVHRANNNTSSSDRASVGFIFYRTDVTVDKEKHDQYQKQLSQNLADKGLI